MMNSIREVEEEEEEGEEEKKEIRDGGASHDLVSFRQEWKRELEGTDKVEGEPEDEEDDVHIRARELFLQGAEYEGDGKLFEAIRCYKSPHGCCCKRTASHRRIFKRKVLY